jgi:hypothetical protein
VRQHESACGLTPMGLVLIASGRYEGGIFHDRYYRSMAANDAHPRTTKAVHK